VAEKPSREHVVEEASWGEGDELVSPKRKEQQVSWEENSLEDGISGAAFY
jgi:hypothetical protein